MALTRIPTLLNYSSDGYKTRDIDPQIIADAIEIKRIMQNYLDIKEILPKI